MEDRDGDHLPSKKSEEDDNSKAHYFQKSTFQKSTSKSIRDNNKNKNGYHPASAASDFFETTSWHRDDDMFHDETEGACASERMLDDSLQDVQSSPQNRQRARTLSSCDHSEAHDVAMMLLPSLSSIGGDPEEYLADNSHSDNDGKPTSNYKNDDMPRIISMLDRHETVLRQTIRRDHLRDLLRRKNIMRLYLKSTLSSMSRNASSFDDIQDYQPHPNANANANASMTTTSTPEALAATATAAAVSNDERRDVATPLPSSMVPRTKAWSSVLSGRFLSTSLRELKEVFASPEELKAEKEHQQKLRNAQHELVQKYRMDTVEFPVEVRLDSLTYKVPVHPDSSKIPTVWRSSQIYRLYKWGQRLWKGIPKPLPTMKPILKDISLVLRPGKMYLILGPPGSGKTSLLRAISGRLRPGKNDIMEGTVSYNGKTLQDRSEFFIQNAVAYIDQQDRHAPRLTVDETLEFGFQCKTAGVQNWMSPEEAKKVLKSHEAERFHVNLVLEALGLTEVKDVFVGSEEVRGVSGGQRRRVTVGEMLMDRTPVLCGDEISTGLDAASTYEMIELINHFGRIQKMSRAIALLQPSPETVSLFDEVIVIAEGQLLFAGPIGFVVDYFAKLGYRPPDHMDVADFLQLVATPDAASLFEAPPEVQAFRKNPYTASELAEMFRESSYARKIDHALKTPNEYVWTRNPEGPVHGGTVTYLSSWHGVNRKYANSFFRASWLNLMRNLTIWRRDKRVLIANFVKNAIMGISVGGVFFQTEDPVSILGALFQGMLFIMLGAMTTAPSLIDDRIIFRKHADANFYSANPFVVGRTLSQLPQMLMDIIVFGSILYWMVGLNPTTGRYFTFLAILFTFSTLMNQMLSVFAAVAPTKPTVQVMCACLLLFLILFGGFIVPPNVIPDYYMWIYWWNPFAWAYRALLVNEFQSNSYSGTGISILAEMGFLYGKDYEKVFGQEWVSYSFFYMLPHFFLCLLLTALGLTFARSSPGASSSKETRTSESNVELCAEGEHDQVEIPFKPVTITFSNICYDVKASNGKEKLRLLNNVNGIFKAGRMTALMGSSGAGKTTLMETLAMRKNDGVVSGEVLLNGYKQDRIGFRRCSGYVEQFDVQTPELTVRETLLYSARLRIDAKVVASDRKKQCFVEQVIRTLELGSFADSLVGSEEGGLSFEQRKRVSIAVELAASPSVIFLDEPTSGLDARSAFLVVKMLRKIADEGRTICCTIHQPSSAVFELFHDLLLLRPGGEVVFFGELGEDSHNLVKYMEARGAHPIHIGENPANWVLSVLPSSDCSVDLAQAYAQSQLFADLKAEIALRKSNPDPKDKVAFDSVFACPARARQKLANSRLATIYWRSPTYNRSRMVVSLIISCIMGSIFLPRRNAKAFSESEMRAKFAVIFLSFIIVGILAIVSVLPVMTRVRDMHYIHRAAGVIDSFSLAWALGNSEKWFIILSSFLFCTVFIGVAGLDADSVSEAIAFWGFFTFNIAIYSYFGQAFVCLVKPMPAAQILASVFIGLNNFFSGLIVRPQFMTGFFNVPFWITPGHFVYEGLIVSLYTADTRTVFAEQGSDFFDDLGCDETTPIGECSGSVSQFVYSFFGGRYSSDNVVTNAIILGGFLVFARVLTFLALTYINFSAT